ncbi:MAG TPA: hypothetical protein VGR73_05385 [Bryobacteraceae bacterium]|nr:hypothetical protein [Bryobacteraceae bacterium]
MNPLFWQGPGAGGQGPVPSGQYKMLRGMESFGEARMRFRQFRLDNGLPSHEIWVDSGDVIVSNGSLYVFRTRSDDRSSSAEARFNYAASREAGVALETICTMNGGACCFVYLPTDNEDAQRLMVPQNGVKLSVPKAPKEAKLVTNSVAWWLLRLRGKDYLRQFHC